LLVITIPRKIGKKRPGCPAVPKERSLPSLFIKKGAATYFTIKKGAATYFTDRQHASRSLKALRLMKNVASMPMM
jgi:hypothetical protein